MNRFNGVLKLHIASPDSKFGWIGLPWLIVLSSLLINVIIGISIGGKTAIYTGGLSSIFIYMFIAVIPAVNSTFPFALGFSIRRTDYFLGTTLIFCLLSLLNAVVIFLLSFIEANLINNWGTQLYFFSLPYLTEGNALQQLAFYFLVMLHMLFTGFFITAIYRRFRMMGLYTVGGAVFLPLSVLGFFVGYFNWWGDVFNWLGNQSAFGLSLYVTPLTALYALFTYLMLRKATV